MTTHLRLQNTVWHTFWNGHRSLHQNNYEWEVSVPLGFFFFPKQQQTHCVTSFICVSKSVSPRKHTDALTQPLQKDEAADNQHRMPVELSQSSVPGQTFFEMQHPPQHEYNSEKSDGASCTQTHHELNKVLHRRRGVVASSTVSPPNSTTNTPSCDWRRTDLGHMTCCCTNVWRKRAFVSSGSGREGVCAESPNESVSHMVGDIRRRQSRQHEQK